LDLSKTSGGALGEKSSGPKRRCIATWVATHVESRQRVTSSQATLYTAINNGNGTFKIFL
jgi:hypothetical protein